jgi:hypothetical protein
MRTTNRQQQQLGEFFVFAAALLACRLGEYVRCALCSLHRSMSRWHLVAECLHQAPESFASKAKHGSMLHGTCTVNFEQ